MQKLNLTLKKKLKRWLSFKTHLNIEFLPPGAEFPIDLCPPEMGHPHLKPKYWKLPLISLILLISLVKQHWKLMGQLVVYVYFSWDGVSNLAAIHHFSGITLRFNYYLDIFPFLGSSLHQGPSMYWLEPSLPNWEILEGNLQKSFEARYLY